MKRLLLAIVAALLLATPAHAALTLCNRTSYVLYAATAAINSPQSQAQGWTRLTPGNCQVARKEALTAETYLVHARTSLAYPGPARAWGGDFPICVRDADFAIAQKVTMPVCKDDTFALSFATLDTHGHGDWTMTLDETPALASLTAAQLAGVKRLLHDNGYAVGPLDAKPSKQTGTALTAFRKRMAFTDRDGNAELFAALEREALKTNAPAGYTVCNDGSADLQVALAENAGAKPVSRGWWTVPHGGCARAITTALHADVIYLLARTKSGTIIVGGGDTFCIAPSAFEIHQRGACTAKGQSEAGFARTPVKGLDGSVVHIGPKGLLPSGGAVARG